MYSPKGFVEFHLMHRREGVADGGQHKGREACPHMACLACPELMVQVSDITTSPAALEPKLSGTSLRKDHPGRLGGVSVLIQADSSSGKG